MASYYNTDMSFYGNYLSGMASPGLYQSWQSASPTAGAYLGASSYQPDLMSLLPQSASGFLRQYVPELGGAQGLGSQIPKSLQEQYRTFLTGGSAYNPGEAQKFALSFAQTPEVQKLIQQQELYGESAMMPGADMGDIQSLTAAIEGQMGKSGSRLSNIYGGLGLGTEQIEKDIRAMIGGQRSAVGDVFERLTLGGRGMATQGARQSLLAQLFGNNMLQLGEGQIFNPFSAEIEPELFRTGLGQSALGGEELLGITAGLLSTQDLDITAQLAGAIQRAQGMGAPGGFGGPKGYRVTKGIGDIADILKETGGSISQSAGGVTALKDLIDLWAFSGVGKGQGKDLYQQMQLAARR